MAHPSELWCGRHDRIQSWPPVSYKGVRLEGKRSIKKLLGGPEVLDRDQVDRIRRILAIAFSPKQSRRTCLTARK